jgi:hypothetical protein
MKKYLLFSIMVLATLCVGFSSCDKEEDETFELKGTTLSLTPTTGGNTTTIEFTSATAFKAVTDGETLTGTYTFVNQILTLNFSDGKTIVLTKEGDTFKGDGYTVNADNSGGGDPGGDNLGSTFTIKATVENGSNYNDKIDIVQVIGTGSEAIIASATYSNGGFTLNLPATVDAKYLRTRFSDYPSGIKVSDTNTKTFDFVDVSAYKNGKSVGYFEYYAAVSDDSEVATVFIYVDRNVNINGSITNKDEYDETITYDNVSLKKGLNKMYVKETDSEKNKIYTQVVTMTEPSGLKWTYWQKN